MLFETKACNAQTVHRENTQEIHLENKNNKIEKSYKTYTYTHMYVQLDNRLTKSEKWQRDSSEFALNNKICGRGITHTHTPHTHTLTTHHISF